MWKYVVLSRICRDTRIAPQAGPALSRPIYSARAVRPVYAEIAVRLSEQGKRLPLSHAI